MGPNRTNPYFAAGRLRKLLAQGLEVFDSDNCANGGYPDLEPPNANFSEDLRNRIIKFFYQATDGIAPACKQQGKSSQRHRLPAGPRGPGPSRAFLDERFRALVTFAR